MSFKNIKIIAEAGVNHNGSLEMAKNLIDVAADCGADFVKFQTFNTENLILKKTEKANYQKKLTRKNESQFEMLKKLEISEEDHIELIKHSKKRKINFLSTAFDIESVLLLSKLKIPIFKIPSGEITNLPYLRCIGNQKKPVILSTGMSTLKEVKNALEVLAESGLKKNKITVLHCTTEYPTPIKDVNLSAMLNIKKELGVEVGYSDHTLGIEVPIAAVALGAIVIEKHFTLDKNLPGPDHIASLEKDELKSMIKSIRNIELALGQKVKKPSFSELKNITHIRKSLVAKSNIKKGDVFSTNNLTTKRPGSGISPMEWDNYIGKKADNDYLKDELIKGKLS